MRIARFPGAGVAVASLVLVGLLGGCSNLTAPPADNRDAGRDLSPDWRGGPDTGTDGARDRGPASADGTVGDGVVNPGSDTNVRETGSAGETGGVGGFGGTGGVGGTGGMGGQKVDAPVDSSIDGGLVSDGPRVIDSTTGSDLGVDGYVAPTDVFVAKDSYVDTLVPTLTVNAGADAMVCAGHAATLGAPAQGGTPPYVYAWTSNPACSNCITNPSSAQTTVSPDATTTFKLTVTDSLGVTASDSVVVTVPSPIADAGAETIVIDPGESVQLGSTSPGGTTYSWTCDRPTCSLSSASAAQPTVNPSLSTMYTLTATSPEGCVATDSATVWINLPVSTSPADGATYPRSGSLFVQFGAPVLESSLSSTTITLREKSSETPVSFDRTYDAASRILTITPKGGNYNAAIGEYTLILTGGANGILSDDPVRAQRLPDNLVVNYTISGTPDNTRPTIESRSPDSGAGNVPTNAGVSAVWSEALNPTTVNVTSFAVWTGMTAVPGSVSYDPETLTVTFVPNADFAASTSYTVWATGIQDIAGNTVSSVSWTFSTAAAADTTPPAVTAVTPVAGATKVSVGSIVTVTFNESVKPASAMAGIQVTTDASSVAGSVAYDNATRQAVFSPSGLLSTQTIYTVTVSGVQDTAGNAMDTAFTSTFTTGNVLFSDAFESGTTKWTLTAPWGLTTSVFASPTHGLTDSPEGNYSGTPTSATILTPIDVTGLGSVTLSYWLSGTMAMYDSFRVEYSTGSGWTPAANLSGDLGSGIRSHDITLASGATQLQIRFRLTPSPYGTMRADGATIDNVLVEAN